MCNKGGMLGWKFALVCDGIAKVQELLPPKNGLLSRYPINPLPSLKNLPFLQL